MLISFSKSLQNSNLEKEYKEIQRDCILKSFDKEKKQNSYTKRLNVLNKKTGLVSNVGDYNSQILKRSHNNLQKSSTIQKLSNDRDLTPIFITITLPSEYHPFSSKKTKKGVVFYKNKNFGFKSISKSIKSGYITLTEIHRKMYKSFKGLDKNMFYINCVEYHKSFIPHFHFLIFVKPELVEKVKKIFDKKKKEYNLSRTDFQVIDNEFGGVELVSHYIRKYMFKSLIISNDTQEIKSQKLTQSRFLDGYLKHFKIRQFRMSNLPVSLEIFNRVYYSIDREFKDKIIEKITPLKKSLFQFVMENVKVSKKILNIQTDKIKTNQFSLNGGKKLFEVFVETIKNTTTSTVVNFLIFQNTDKGKRLIYNKQDYKVLKN